MEVTKYPSIRAMADAAVNGAWRTSSVFLAREYRVDEAKARWDKGPSERQIESVRRIMDNIDASFRDRGQPQWVPSPFGAFPVVPDYLAGDIFSMRHKVSVESELAPITFWVEAGLSFTYSEAQAEARAAAIAALIARTAETRPVEAKIVCASTISGRSTRTRDIFVQADIDMHTFDASFVAKVMVMPEIIRPLRWAAITASWEGINHIGFASKSSGYRGREARIRKEFNAQPQDVVIQAAISDIPESSRMIYDPVRWVHQQIEKQREVADE